MTRSASRAICARLDLFDPEAASTEPRFELRISPEDQHCNACTPEHEPVLAMEAVPSAQFSKCVIRRGNLCHALRKLKGH